MPYVIAFFTAALVFGGLDFFWLGWADTNLYRPVIGEIMADDVRLSAAGVFYLLYLSGIMWFAVRPGILARRSLTAAFNGALLGGLCYATFDLTNQAVMKVWATHITLADIALGAFATAVASGAACWLTLRLTHQGQAGRDQTQCS